MISFIRSLAGHVFGFRKRATFGRFTSKRIRGYQPSIEWLERRDAPAAFNVANLNNAGAGSLRRALDDLNATGGANNQIIFPAALTGTLSLKSALPKITKSVDIVRGPGAPQPITITRNPLATTNFALLDFQNFTAPSTVLVSGFTFSGGTQGAIFADGLAADSDLLTNFTVRQCTFSGNTSPIDGGAIAAVFVANVGISDCAFNGNSADGGEGSGGAVFFSGGGVLEPVLRTYKRTLTITNTNFNGNTAAFGGAVSADVERVSITGGTFTLNTASFAGGAVYRDLRGEPLRSRLDVTGTLFFVNIASSWSGGAIWNGKPISGAITDCTFLINGAGGDGGAVYDPFELLDSTNNTFYGNGAYNGGAWCSAPGATGDGKFANTIFYDNTAVGAGSDVYGDITSLGHNLIGDDSDSDGWIGSDFLNEDPKLNSLGYYGGATETMTLQSDSPALDAGDNTYVDESTDERGDTRIVNSTVDIGAVEMQSGEYSLAAPYAYPVDFGVGYEGGFSVDGSDSTPTLLDYSGNHGKGTTSLYSVNGSTGNVGVAADTTEGGSVTVNSNGTFDYTAPDDFVGDDSFTVAYYDSGTTAYRTQTVTIHATDVVAVDADFSTLKSHELSVDGDTQSLLYYASAASGDDLSVTEVNGSSGNLDTNLSLSHGTLHVYATGAFDFTPTTGYTGDQTFTVTVSDGIDAQTSTVTIHIAQVLATTAEYSVQHDDELTVSSGSGLVTFGTDADSTSLHISEVNGDSDGVASAVTTELGGTVTVASNGSFVYDPPFDTTGDDSFAYTISNGSATTTATVVIHIEPDIAVAAVEVNGGAPAYLDANGLAFDLAGQNSVVEQILVTFNQPVSLDSGAFSIVNNAGAVTVNSGPAPNTSAVSASFAEVSGSGGTQFIVTFSGAGTIAIPGGTGHVIKNGLYILHTDGSKVHADGHTAPADNDTGFWALFGDVTYHDISGVDLNVGTGYVGDGYSDASVGSPDYALFGDTYNSTSDNEYAPPEYDYMFDFNLDGSVAAGDWVAFTANYNADWQF
jgi:Bacterial Ig domain